MDIHPPRRTAVSIAALALTLVLALLLSCGKLKELQSPTDPGGGGPVDPSATFTRVQTEILTPTCATLGCHDTLAQQEQLVLIPSRSYAALVNVTSVQMPALKRVTPLDPANSYVYRKVTGTGITGERMPQGGAPLTEAQLALLRNWILRGAPND
jgi:hypothetical protein